MVLSKTFLRLTGMPLPMDPHSGPTHELLYPTRRGLTPLRLANSKTATFVTASMYGMMEPTSL
jgi:hypothetical protein